MSNKSQICKLFLAALLTAQAALASHTFTLSTRDFVDANGNGLIDCGEEVVFQVGLFDNDATFGTVAQGRVIVPTSSIRFAFRDAVLDPLLQANCAMTITNLPSSAQIDYNCAPPNSNSGGYASAILIHGFYTGPAGSITLGGQDILQQPPTTLNVTTTEGRVNSCLTADLALTKSDGGISVRPGQTVPYTLTYTNSGNTSVQAAIQETVPANTVFATAQSSPGWNCAGTSPGSSCTFNLGSIPISGSGSRIFAITVSPTTPPAVRQITNTATISPTDGTPDVDPSNNTATDTTPIIAGTPDLALTKTLTTSGGSPGSVAVFTLTVTDQGTGVAEAVSLTETVPPNSSFAAAQSSPDWTCSGITAGATCTASLGTLASGGSASRTFAVTIAKPFPAGATAINNTACTATTTAGDPASNNCASATAPVTAAANLALKKTLASGTGTPGANLVFNLTVTNSGNQDSAPTVLQETVPPNTTYNASLSSSGWSCSGTAAGSTCTLNLPSVPGAGASVTRAFAVTVANPLPAGVTSIANTACDGAACGSIQVPTDGQARLSVTKSVVSGTATPGTTLVFGISVKNLGNQGAPVALSETVPAHTTFNSPQSSAWSCAGTAAGLSCSLDAGTLAGGGTSTTYHFAVTIDSPLPNGVTVISNSACASTPSTPQICDQVQVPANASPRLMIAKTRSSAAPAPGQLVTYSIAISNLGDQDAGAVTLTEQVPTATSFDAPGSDPAWSCSAGTCTLVLPSLAAGTTVTRNFSVRVTNPLPAGVTQIANTVCGADVPSRNVCSTVTDPAGGSPQLSIHKTYSGPPLAPGASLPFQIVVSNTGTQGATGVHLTETIPSHTTFEATASDPGWTCVSPAAGQTCGFSIATLAAGASSTVTFAVKADSPLPPNVRQIANSACAIVGSTTSCDQTSTPLPVSLTATLDDTLSTDANNNSLLDNGDVITYTLIVKNPSGQAAQSIKITTALDARLGLIVGSVTTDKGTITSGNGSGDTTLALSVSSLGPGETLTVIYQALAVNLAGAGNPNFVSAQNFIAGDNFDSLPSDDPATPDVVGDPTLTPLKATVTPSIPTLSQIGLATLASLLGLCALPILRQRQVSQP
jgi:large repetitive protein